MNNFRWRLHTEAECQVDSAGNVTEISSINGTGGDFVYKENYALGSFRPEKVCIWKVEDGKVYRSTIPE